MTTYSTIYYDVSAIVPVTLEDTDSETPLISSINLADGSGCKALRRITIPANLTSGTVLTFEVVENAIDSDFASLNISDGSNDAPFSITADGTLKTVSMPAIIFDSVRFFKMILSAPVSEDTVFKFIFEPIYQGQA